MHSNAWSNDSNPTSPQPVSATHYQDVIRPVLIEYCGECHAPDDENDPVRFLRNVTADEIAGNRGIWASVAEQLRNRTMPPADEQQPSEEERRKIADWISNHLTRTACEQDDFAGNPVARRINRDQYTYAIEDLTGLDFDFIETFPADGSGGEGFDNNGETLFLPPLLLERYFEVAQDVIDRAVVTEPFDVTYLSMPSTRDPEKPPHKKESGNDIGVLLVPDTESFGTDRGVLKPGQTARLVVTVPTEDDFGLTIKAIHDSDDRENLDLSVDGLPVKTLHISRNKNAPSKWTQIHFAKGVHQVDLTVPPDSAAMKIQWVRLNQDTGDKNDRRARQKATDRIFAPAGDAIGSDDQLAARRVMRAFAEKAWRRPVTDAELGKLTDLYKRGIQRGESMMLATKLPLKAILVSPHFLFLTEKQPTGSGIHRISDLELASRLSFFLWHSLPDRHLINLAKRNELHTPDVLRAQVRRMLLDERSDRFANAFAGQWLGTVAVGRTVIPDTNHFKDAGYTTELVTDLRQQVAETMVFMIRENRTLTEWLDCDYVVVNKRLAKHYSLNEIPKSNERFELVRLNDSTRPGVLGMGAVHMLTSYSRRTSPVLRGGWVLETIFGVHLPSPPPDAGNLSGGEKEDKKKTVRSRLSQHRENPSCAACHDLIDPIGFALENFDVIGRWRENEGKLKIDAKGKLPSGEEFTGPRELRRVLIARKDEFLHQISQRMLGYALGRSLEDADQCTVTQLTDRLKTNDAKIQELIIGIVESIPFQHRQGS